MPHKELKQKMIFEIWPFYQECVKNEMKKSLIVDGDSLAYILTD